MRTAFVETLVSMAEDDPRILLLTGDLGFMALEPFAQRFPDRFINMGVAEQNMIGVATGMAEAGFVPFAYSIATFAALRTYEFIRNGPVLHDLPVRIVGMGGGFEYGPAGSSHHALDDVGALRVQPGLTIIAPADPAQARTAIRASASIPGPIYYRLGKDDRMHVNGLNGRFVLGHADLLRDGTDVLLVSMGNAAVETMAACEMLVDAGIDCGMVNVASVQPAPVKDLAEALSRVPTVVTVEAHFAVGALGSLVSEIVASEGLGCRLVQCAVHDPPDGASGGHQYLLDRHGLSRAGIAAAVMREVIRSPNSPPPLVALS